MNSDNKISIVVPFFNRIQLLEKTIESVLHQSSEDWELILVDDGSTEDTSILRQYTISPKIRLFKNEKETSGAPSARNFGASKAKYSYLMFLDSDDLMAPWCIGARLDHLKNNPNVHFSIFTGLEFDENDPFHHRLRTIREIKDPLKGFLSFQSVWQTSCVVWRKGVFEDIGGWKEDVLSWQDGEIHIRLLTTNPRFSWGSEVPDIFIRRHEETNRISNRLDIEAFDNLIATYEKTASCIKDIKLRRLFEENIVRSLFDKVESVNKDLLDKYEEWVLEELSNHYPKKILLQYIRVYQRLNQNSLTYRLLYQLRKRFYWPISRRPFWAIRPQLTDNLKKELKSKLEAYPNLISSQFLRS